MQRIINKDRQAILPKKVAFFVLTLLTILPAPCMVKADDYDRREWREQEARREHERHEHREWIDGRWVITPVPPVVYEAPAPVYAPPVVYAPPPAYEAPGINLIVPLHIR